MSFTSNVLVDVECSLVGGPVDAVAGMARLAPRATATATPRGTTRERPLMAW
jgi:hypothetical protein